MRFLSILLILLPMAASASTADLARALQTFRGDPPHDWSYTQSTSAQTESTVEHYDATKPEFERWSLVKKNGRTPTAEESGEYNQIRSRRSRGGTAPKLSEQLDLTTAELITKSDTQATYRCRLKPAESGDRTAPFLRATVVLHLTTSSIASIELANAEPFSPAFGVKITEMRTTLTYAVPTPDRPAVPVRVATRVRGTAFWFKSLDAEMTVEYSDFEKARKK